MSYNPYIISYYSSVHTSPVQPVPTDIPTPSSSQVYPHFPAITAGVSLRVPTSASSSSSTDHQPNPATIETPPQRNRAILNDGSREAWLKHVAKLSDEEVFGIPYQDILGIACMFVPPRK